MNNQNVPTPCFVVEEEKLIKNLEILHSVMERTGCHILLAQKCFSMYHVYPLIGQYLSGTTASGLYEARLGKEYMDGETHVYRAAYREDEIDEILSICDHVIFNSFSQWEKYKEKAMKSSAKCGIRINPECSTQEGHAIYDPCSPGSRMGVTKKAFDEYAKTHSLEGITGLHFHTLCEQNSDDLKVTLQAVEEKFGEYLPQMEWLNFGGGHHITRDDYDIETLVTCINHMKDTYQVQVILEPGEAVALNAGYLISTVLDVIENGTKIAILDTSAACHMPDVLEMPYTPQIVGAKIAKEQKEEERPYQYTYRLGGPTCLAGDVIGDYVFDHELQPGERLMFLDMAIYSMVKTNTFNGMKLPDIALKKTNDEAADDIELVNTFGYEDFKCRL